MNTDVELLLREGLDRLTMGARVPAGMAGRVLARRRRRRAAGYATAVAAAAAVTAALIAGVMQGPPTLAKPVVSAWQPARSLPGAGGGVQVSGGTWRLASYLVSKGWQENTAGPEPGYLTCPTAATCYVEGNSATSPSGAADMNSFYITTDGTRTWSVLPVPDGVTFTSALSCATQAACAAGGLYYGHQPAYLSTGNGGHSWTIDPLPAGFGTIRSLACASPVNCRGLAAPLEKSRYPGFDGIIPDAHFFSTADGGGHFTTTAFPKHEWIASVNCPTPAHCVADGVYDWPDPHDKSRTSPDFSRGVVLTSDDGGITWQQGTWPASFGQSAFPEVTCVDASHCRLLGYIIGKGPQGGSMSVSPSGKITETVPDQYSVIGFSADGGATWRASTFPPAIPYPSIDALACPTIDICYAAGGDAVPQRIGNTYNGGSSVVAVTRDAGRTWQRVSFAVPAKVPSGMQGDSFLTIGQIQCPAPDACVAIGVSDQGSTSTPIYTNHG